MKRATLRSLPLVCLLASGLGASAFAQTSAAAAPSAAASGPSKVAVINFQAAVAQTNEGQRNFAELQQKYEPKRTQLKTQSDEIDTLKKELQASGDKLGDAERQTRLRTIDEKEKALQRAGEDASNDFQSEMQQTYQQLAEKVYGSLQSYAESNGYTVVLDAATAQNQAPVILWANKGTDITAAVIQTYNTKSGVPAPATPVPSAPTPSRPAHTAPKQ
jgi:outer membrane protein